MKYSALGACSQRLELNYDDPLSNFAFKFNLRRYGKSESAVSHVSAAAAAPSVFGDAPEGAALVGCRTLSVVRSTPLVKGPLNSRCLGHYFCRKPESGGVTLKPVSKKRLWFQRLTF